MKARRLLSLLMVLSLIFTLSATALASRNPRPVLPRVVDTYAVSALTATNKVADLHAGQNTDVGDLFINRTAVANQFLVTYQLTAHYYFGEIHFEAISDNTTGFANDSALIYSNGGIIPGQLTVKESFALPVVNELTGAITGGTQKYSFIYTSGAPVQNFAAHSVVFQAKSEAYTVSDTIVGSRTDTGFIASGAIEGQPVVLVREPFGYPEPGSEYVSVWDNEFAASPDWQSKLMASGARFVWNAELSSGLTGTPVPTSNPLTINGDIFTANLAVTVPTDATAITATLYIVADNGYIAKIGNTIISSAGFNAEAYAALTDNDLIDDTLDGDQLLLHIFDRLIVQNADGEPLFVEGVVPSGAWQGMIAVGSNVPLAPGLNTVNIKAMNEHMDGGNDYNNPAGVIYFIEYQWTVPTYTTVTITLHRLVITHRETAWGMGLAATGSNWSQIIPNTNLPVFVPPAP